MAIESLSFDKGINRKKSPLLLEEGETYTCVGFNFSHDGVLEARTPKIRSYSIDSDPPFYSRINSIHRYGDNLYASSRKLCPGNQSYFNYIYHRNVDDTSWAKTNKLLANNTRPRMTDFEKFTFVVDGESKRAFIDEHGYNWGIPNPSTAPSVSAGAASASTPDGPSGDYSCYVTFLIKFPNDKYVETGPSPVGEVTVTDQKVEWVGIPSSGYEGFNITIHRRLWRTVSGEVYLVYELPDNTTSTYSDDNTDAVLQLKEILGTDGYGEPHNSMVDTTAGYLQRSWGIYDNRITWSEPYKPFSFLATSDIVVTKDNENLVAIVDWGDQMFIVSTDRWYRLQGHDPDTWAIKRTFTDTGIVNRNTLRKSVYGLIGLWNDGIYLFDGSLGRNITLKKLGTEFFTDLDDLSVCFAEFDGSKYYFYYASSGTTVDSCIVIDFTYAKEGDIRVFQDNFIPHAYELYRIGNIRYFAKDGYEYTETSATEIIPTNVVTSDKAFEKIIQLKNPTYLFYDINTDGKDITINILADGTTVDSMILNTSLRVRKRSRQLKQSQGYRFTVEFSCADSSGLKIYSPWALEATPVGD